MAGQLFAGKMDFSFCLAPARWTLVTSERRPNPCPDGGSGHDGQRQVVSVAPLVVSLVIVRLIGDDWAIGQVGKGAGYRSGGSITDHLDYQSDRQFSLPVTQLGEDRAGANSHPIGDNQVCLLLI